MAYRAVLFAAASAASLLAAPAYAQSGAAEVQELIVTGTRAEGRTRLESLAPVDVINQEALNKVGVTELNQALAVSLPRSTSPAPASPTAPTRCARPPCAAWRLTRPWCW